MVLGSNHGGSKNFFNIFVQTGPRAHQPPLLWVQGLLTRGKVPGGMVLIICPHLLLRLCMSRTVPPLPLYANHVILQGQFYIYRKVFRRVPTDEYLSDDLPVQIS